MKTQTKNHFRRALATNQSSNRSNGAAPLADKTPAPAAAKALRRALLLPAMALTIFCATTASNAHQLYMNFDSVMPGSGLNATAYLATFGVTLTNVSNPGSVYIVSDTNFYGSGVVTASSRHNFLLQNVAGSPPGVSYTLNFAAPLQSLRFTRCAVNATTATPMWSETAYAGSTAVDSVGVCCVDSDTGQPAQTYTLAGPGITALTVTGNGEDFAAMASAPLDDFYLTPAAVLITNVSIPSGLLSLAVNPALDKIYLSGGASGPPTMIEVDGATLAQTAIGAGSGADVDRTNDNYWSAGVGSGTVTAWDQHDNSLTNISLGDCPIAVDVDPVHRKVWVANQCGGGNDPVWVLNADTFATIRGPIGTSGVQGLTQVNPTTGRFYLDSGGVSKRINPSTYALTTNKFGTVLGVNASSNLLYAVTNGSTLQIINGAPDPEVIKTNVALGFQAGGYIGVNPEANRIYVGAAGSNFVAELNGTNGALLETISLNTNITEVGSIAVDSVRGKVYILAYSASSSYLYVVQDVAPPAITVAPGNATTSTGGSVTLSVEASGYPLLYQWYF